MTYDEQLAGIESAGLLRKLRAVESLHGAYCRYNNKQLLNLTSNDYLGLANNAQLRETFYKQQVEAGTWQLGASSSRLLTGNTTLYDDVEDLLRCNYMAEAALFYNSGYHANTGILPALTEKKDLILSDKLCHASIIDGIRLSDAEHVRYRHLDYEQLSSILNRRRHFYQRVFIVTESVFSMDGDAADLEQLVAIKEQYGCILYVDEAHAVGVLGDKGLGLCEVQQVINRIDIIVGTLGKAYASVGAFAIVNTTIKRLLVNKSRTLIYTTALPPVNMAWTKFVTEQMADFAEERKRLEALTEFMYKALFSKGYPVHQSHIMPVFLGANDVAVQLSEHLQKQGYLVFPIRPPTVPVNTARLRISLTSDMQQADIERMLQYIPNNNE
ncbi:8-amino-7-oxononanoate synthase [Carboxylicivirga sediminis]|uniref:8-amino-7-oxononanoate synthase n=1 Tax=Carboxylicivirga sediminis TaxID=2006564 RepID=A0A941ISS2_9BACT|nr:8-amino-7-oxononanoate synthase [Carboxylicivirga sediminis]MBR8533971.1 8-amino-7-oxononanoate synthase [Carboxylicivirga sediminis]